MDTATQHAWYLWAKSDLDKNDGRYLPVLTHLLDVAACAWEILELEPPRTLELLAQDYGLEVEAARRWVCALVGLHDLGKASPTFQALWDMGAHLPAGIERLLPQSEKKYPHGEVSQLLLASILPKFRWSKSAAGQVADAVGCHHGRRTPQPNIPSPERGLVEWEAAQLVLVKKVLLALGLRSSPPLPDLSSAAFMRLSGLTSFADWVGSSFEVPAQVDPLPIENPAAYFEKARGKARLKLQAIGWTQRKALQEHVQSPGEMFSYIPGFVPRALQTQLADLLPTLDAEPALILVEAPMGEGKTEAGLHAATWLQTKVGHRGLYIALPTMATGNAMYTRFSRFLGEAARGRGIVPDLQLLHGGTLLNKDYQQHIQYTRNPPTDPETLREDAQNVRAESWFTLRKRAQLTEYGVGTVDQALLGVLSVPHQFVRLWGLGNRVVLLDEIHAYDTYTSQLIYALIRWLRALGSSVILMSATLPLSSRRQLLQAWGSPGESETVSYPRLTVAQSGAATAHHIAASRTQTPMTVRALGASAQEVAAKALELSEGGGCVAVIVNTVQRAQEVFRTLRASYPGNIKTLHNKGKKDDLCLLLFHARYPADERARREEAVSKYLGPQSHEDGQDDRPYRMILVATQVAEQSLDFDADVMISDLAPIDLILQRAGRLHRHAANNGRRYGHEAPELWISALTNWPAQALEQQKWQWVYAPYLLYRSWLVLQDGQTVRLPDDLDRLVQHVYGPKNEDPLTPEQAATLNGAKLEFEHHTSNEGTLGNMAHIGNPATFFSHYPVPRPEPDGEPTNDDASQESADEFPRTRLGEESARIVPVMKVDGKWIVCPPPKGIQKKDEPWQELLPGFKELEKGDLERVQRIYRRSLSVSRWEIVQAAKRGELWSLGLGNKNKGWAAHALLRDMIPLDLTAGHKDFGRLRVTLDPKLGLIYET